MYLLLVIALILQSTVIGYIRIFNVMPDLALLLVIFFGLFFGLGVGLEIGFVAGLLKDILSTDIFGINTLTLAITGLTIGALSAKFFKESRTTQAILVFAFALFSMLIHYLIFLFLSDITYINLSEYLSALIIPSSLYTSFISLIIFPVIMNMYNLGKTEEFL